MQKFAHTYTHMQVELVPQLALSHHPATVVKNVCVRQTTKGFGGECGGSVAGVIASDVACVKKHIINSMKVGPIANVN